MRRQIGFLAGILVMPSIALAVDKPVTDPAATIAAADASRHGEVQGRFAMTVVAVGRVPKAVYLNSDADYRSPRNLTFILTPSVESELARRYGQPADVYLIGKRVVVDGFARRVRIVNTNYGRVQGFNRWAHQVNIRLPSQIVSVD